MILFCVLAGCSSGGSGGGLDTPDAYNSELDKALCAYNARCGYYGASEVKQCESDAVAAAKMYPPAYSISDAVKMKRLGYDATKAKVCIDAIAKAGCSNDSYYALSDTCNPVFSGLVKTGGACLGDFECATGNWCDQGANNGTTGCSGVCTANVASGGTCDPNASHCNTSDYCDDTSMACKARAKLGQSCSSSQPCEGVLDCKGYDAGPPEVLGTCSNLGQVGDACFSSFIGTTNCSLGLWCDDTDLNNPVCAKPIASGASCTSYFGCADGLDCIGLAFDNNTGDVLTTGTCKPFLDVGKACDSSGESGCPFDTTCDAASSTCKAGGKAGDTCDPQAFGGCSGNSYCDGNTSKCAVKVALGGACMQQPTDASGFPLGDDPCHDGSCDAMSNKCSLVCQ
jgi:hypothetical protein